MYCKYCGKELDGTETFCTGCGNPVNTIQRGTKSIFSRFEEKVPSFRSDHSGFHRFDHCHGITYPFSEWFQIP